MGVNSKRVTLSIAEQRTNWISTLREVSILSILSIDLT